MDKEEKTEAMSLSQYCEEYSRLQKELFKDTLKDKNLKELFKDLILVLYDINENLKEINNENKKEIIEE